MGKSFDIGLERLTGAGAWPGSETERRIEAGRFDTDAGRETFYLETFGCQMNEHDSEKVAGVLLARGYKQVETPEAAKVILYNVTCGLRGLCVLCLRGGLTWRVSTHE